MAIISTIQARAQLTSMCVDVYQDMLEPTGFLRSFFPTVQEFTRFVSIQTERDLELAAQDAARGSEGTRNKFTNQTEKVIDPGYYREYFEMTDIDIYDRLFGSTAIDAGVMSQFVQIASRRLAFMRNKIERAYEIQAAQVLQTGVVTLVNGDSVDYRRKAASLVANSAGNTWATGTVDPFATMAAGAKFLRTVGKTQDTTFVTILGEQAAADLFNNTIFKGRVTQNLNNAIDSINMPQRSGVGSDYLGMLTIGSWKTALMTYPQYYDIVNSGTVTATPYIDPKKITMIPLNPRFKLAFAAVPRVLGGDANTSISAGTTATPYLVEEYVDPRLTSHIMDIKSAGIVIPTAVDQMYTVQVVA